MPLIVFLLAGMILAAYFAFQGLVSGSLAFSKKTQITGTAARIIGAVCLLVCLGCTGLAITLGLALAGGMSR